MSEGARDELTAKLPKRANEENEESAERVQTTKRLKAEEENTEDEKKYPKKKVVLLMAYSGKGYYGMQVYTALFSPLISTKLLVFLHPAKFECFPCFREILEPLSFAPLKMIWSLRLSNLVAFLKTMAPR